MIMSSAATVVMQDHKRGESPRKQHRLPAIAPKDDQSSTSSSRSGRIAGPAVPQRQRLPPRSRTGCWTCRHRKVKCDEGRPVCSQCARLGHACDYSPRLSFRDDTQRVVDRMQDVTVAGSTVWDGLASPTPSSAGSTIADDLPPFPSLMTDEERERKAEASSPGTYNVVVNPDSFQHLPEYSDDIDIKRELLSPLRRASIAASLASSLGRDSAFEGVPVPGDPNTVILPRFEDLSRRTTRELKSPVSPTIPFTRNDDPSEITTKIKEVKVEDEGDKFEHFRNVVWKQLVPTDVSDMSGFSDIEILSRKFPPLYHAILAVASQSSVQGDTKENFDALQHYTQAIEHLKREEDLASDGVFLTHFLLLVYEIATADVEHSSMRMRHLDTLAQISSVRRQSLVYDQFPFIIWHICNIDLETLLSGTGNGEFITQMLASDVVPPPSYHLYPLSEDGFSVILDEERDTLPTVLQLNYDVTIQAVRLAAIAQEFRREGSLRRLDSRQRDRMIGLRQSRLFEIQEALRRIWLAPHVRALDQKPLSIRPRRVWERAYTLYRACLLLSHTSVWPGQRLDTPPEFDEEVTLVSSEILFFARSIIYSGHLECRYLVFPIFVAGFSSTNGSEKMLALDLLTRMEQQSIGRNIVTTRHALEAIYDQQNERFMSTGHSLDVDWMDVMADYNLRVVNFAM